ncbi:hypothetical protein [Knoellia aerolata]|uniref:Uncharacterized protein n=1 Tax=Knoellia aerolata DSM 18566 TaxID=1385519 RepID=A0A0A0JU81_9MICO|nr:hypothetical protein [Knoellia aerolata]KGN40935.1 hypothetical protein N801_10110 [Knoellia aerolata DSM 18566]
MRTRLIAAAAAAAISAGIAVTSAAPAHAAGWGTISSSAVGTYLSKSSWTYLGRSFSTASNVSYRYCVVGRGSGSANLQPTAFGTTVSFSHYGYDVTRCTKSFSGAANTFQPVALLGSGTVLITKVYVQRYYTGPIPV